MANVIEPSPHFNDGVEVPPKLTPDLHPIICRHVYGVEPAELRLRRRPERDELLPLSIKVAA